MYHKKLSTIAFFALMQCANLSTNAQTEKEIPLLNSAEIMKMGIAAHDSGDYKAAIKYYGQVPEGDTNYQWALYESALSNLRDSSYERSIEQSQKAIAMGYYARRESMLNIGSALDYLGKKDEALKMYDSVQRMYPYDYRPYFEKAIIQYKDKNYKDAELSLQQSLMLNPQHFRSHYLLGGLYAAQGRLSEAILALNTSLLCTAEIQSARGPIAMLDAIATQTDEIAGNYNNRDQSVLDHAFDESDEIVHAKLALDRGYKLKSELDDNIFRQLQVVMEKLEYDKNDAHFSMQFYVPLFVNVYKNNQFEPFVLQLFSDYGIKSIDKATASRKGKGQVEEIRKVIYPYLKKIYNTNVLNYEERLKATEPFHYYEDNHIMVKGIYSDLENKKMAAGFVQYYQEESLIAEGNYDADGKKDGVWKYYYQLGNPKLVEEYSHGTPVNESKSWHSNGVLKEQSSYDKEGVQKELKEYSYSGILEDVVTWKAKDEYEYTYYYPSGKVSNSIIYKNDKIKDGTYISYYDNGQKKEENSYRNEKLEGKYVSYFDNGQIEQTATYSEGKVNGPVLSYHKNGQLANKMDFTDGFKTGESISYDEYGKMSFKLNYIKGKAEGDGSYYNDSGKVYGIINYKHDKINGTKFYAPDGKEIASADKTTLNVYNKYRVLLRKEPLNTDGKSQGKANYYYESGALKETTTYKNDLKDGPSLHYYESGNLRISTNYKNDTTDGYYKYYNLNGSLNAEGWMKNNLSAGTWHNYNENGTLSRDVYFVNDEINGPEKNYEADGKLDYINHYDLGMIVGLTQYDTAGKVIQDVTFDKGNGKYTILHQNGTPGLAAQLKYGDLNGPYTIHGGNKQLLEKGTYLNGKSDSLMESFFPDGSKRMIGFYDKGEKDKTWKIYGRDGKLESIYHYENGDQEGADSNYNGGNLRSVVQYHNDEIQGTYTVYGDNQKVAAVLYFDEGVLVGYSWEDETGKLKPMRPVVNASAHMQTTYSNGEKALDWTYEKNNMNGKQVLYYSNGKVAEEQEFVAGKRTGAFNQFNPDGSKYYEAGFKNDEKVGACKYYNNKGQLIFVVEYKNGKMHGKAQMTDAAGKTHTYWYYYDSLEQ